MTSDIVWKAIYNDGTELFQYDGDKVHKYSDIDRARIVKFALFRDNKLVLVVHLDKNKRLIYRRRVALKVMSGEKEVVYLAGWQENRNGVNVQQISFVFEDGHIEVVDRFYETHKWFYPINFMPEEK